ncbi:MAG TPA: DUF6152 family protein [Povalibacter sp.]|nr:DUF6152 family protein [Povalibacter sp.]
MKVRNLLRLAAALLCLSAPAFAHHSQAMFDETRMVTLSGVVTKFSWINPHVQIYFNVTEKGKSQVWQIEANSALTMARSGWKRDQFKVGDKVTVSFHPMRNGTPFGYLRKIVGPDGKALEMAGGTGGPPPSAAKKPSP